MGAIIVQTTTVPLLQPWGYTLMFLYPASYLSVEDLNMGLQACTVWTLPAALSPLLFSEIKFEKNSEEYLSYFGHSIKVVSVLL